MIANLISVLGIGLAISLVGCGVRGPLYLPTVPPVPNPPTQAEPKGTLYPPKSTAPNQAPVKQ